MSTSTCSQSASPEHTPMTLARLRLMTKRPFMVLSFFTDVAVAYAIGSEVAAETNSSDVMRAPARLTAIWRVSMNEKNILLLPFAEPPIGLTAYIAGSVPIQKYRLKSIIVQGVFSMKLGHSANLLGISAAMAADLGAFRWLLSGQ